MRRHRAEQVRADDVGIPIRRPRPVARPQLLFPDGIDNRHHRFVGEHRARTFRLLQWDDVVIGDLGLAPRTGSRTTPPIASPKSHSCLWFFDFFSKLTKAGASHNKKPPGGGTPGGYWTLS